MKKGFYGYIYFFASIMVAVLFLSGCGGDDKEDEKQTATENTIVVSRAIDSGDIPVEIQIEKDDAIVKEENEEIPENDDTAGDASAEGSEDIPEENMDEDDSADDKSATEEASENGDEADTVSNKTVLPEGEKVSVAFDTSWKYADFSAINSGSATLYRAPSSRKNVVIGVNAGHGTKGGTGVKTYSHPDMTPKVTGGTNALGAVKSTAVSAGMTFNDGTSEAAVTLREAQLLRDRLLAEGYDVLMIRDGDDVQLDNVARTVMCNNIADCHIAIHWDSDGLDHDKGCFFISTPDAIKGMEPVASTWQRSEALGRSLIDGLSSLGCRINGNGSMNIDLTQTSFSSVPSVDIELGNSASAHDDAALSKLADGLVLGIKGYFR